MRTRLNLLDVKDKTAEQIFDEAVAEGKITPEQREEFERQTHDDTSIFISWLVDISAFAGCRNQMCRQDARL